MKLLQVTVILFAITFGAIGQIIIAKHLSAAMQNAAIQARVTAEIGSTMPNTVMQARVTAELPDSVALVGMPVASPREPLLSGEERAAGDRPYIQQASLEEEPSSFRNYSPDSTPAKQDHSYLAYYVYAELPPNKKPADIALELMKDISIGTPLEEIKRASDLFGLDFNFMKTVAKIESDFDPKQRTGSYVGLFQLNNYEFGKYGSGDIMNPRDNAIAAAYKFVSEATLFELDTHRKPTFSDLYLIHQQGWQGAAEHVSHPERVAWKSMCATDEGREKGEKWCKRAIWGNTLPDIKRFWKSVDKLTSTAFVTMWRERVDHLYTRYSAAAIEGTKH
jgi:hypothetical protein